MTALPERQNSTAAAIFQQYEKSAEAGQRPHLGASELGHECERYLWLSFRWARQPVGKAGCCGCLSLATGKNRG